MTAGARRMGKNEKTMSGLRERGHKGGKCNRAGRLGQSKVERKDLQ